MNGGELGKQTLQLCCPADGIIMNLKMHSTCSRVGARRTRVCDLCRTLSGGRSVVPLYQTLQPFRSNLEGPTGGANGILMTLQKALNMVLLKKNSKTLKQAGKSSL